MKFKPSDWPTVRDSRDDPWDICADFLEPLGSMLWEWCRNRWLQSLYDATGNIPTDIDKYDTNFVDNLRDCEEPWLLAPQTLRLVYIWLQVNVSCELAEHVSRRIAKVQTLVKDQSKAGLWPTTGEACWYFKDLARVLRQRRGIPISKAELQAEAEAEAETKDFFGPYTLADLTNGRLRKDGTYRKGLLEIGTSAFYDRVKKAPNKYRKGSGNTWFVHKTVLPSK